MKKKYMGLWGGGGNEKVQNWYSRVVLYLGIGRGSITHITGNGMKRSLTKKLGEDMISRK